MTPMLRQAGPGSRTVMMSWTAPASTAVAAVLVLLGQPQTVHACAPLMPAPAGALPSSGAVDVSPATSIVVMKGGAIPAGLVLEAAGVPVMLPTPVALGGGLASGRPATFHRVAGMLTPSTSYVLRATDAAGAAQELTRFTTAATYDKVAGTAPKITGLRLWRVRYPVSAIAAGGCVFDEYHGYVDVDYEDGAIPGTPADEVLGTVELRPENGTQVQSFLFTGGRFDGLRSATPDPALATWRPELAPDRTYCVTITLSGRNDIAVGDVRSNMLCVPVVSLDQSGGGDGGVADGGGDGPVGGDGGRDAGDGPLGVPTDAEQRPGGLLPKADKDGCSFAGSGGSTPLGWLMMLAVVILRLRHRRS